MIKLLGELFFISSSSIYSTYYAKGYKYPFLKLSVENYIKSNFENHAILRLGVIKELNNTPSLYGNVNLTDEKTFINSMLISINKDRNVNAWRQTKFSLNILQNITLNLTHFSISYIKKIIFTSQDHLIYY